MNKDIFANLYKHTFDKNSPFWQKENDLNSVSDVEELIFWFETELEKTQSNLEQFQEIGKCFLNDLLKLKQDKPGQIGLIDFLQFQISTLILNFLASRKYMNYCYDWLCNSICIEFVDDIKREIESDRIVNFRYSENPYILIYFKETFLNWSNNLFYYSRTIGGLNDLCIIYLDDFYKLLIEIYQEQVYIEELISPLVNISTWCYVHKKEDLNKKSCQILFDAYKSNISIHSKKIIAFHFSCRKNSYNNYSRKQWCEILINIYSSELQAHEHLQLFANLYEDNCNEIISNVEKLYKSIDIYHDFIEAQNNGILINYELVRHYNSLSNLLVTLITNGKTAITYSIICYYFKICVKTRFADNILFIIPNSISGVMYSTNNNIIYTDTNTFQNIQEITKLNNDFFSTTITFNDYLEFEYETPYRLGAPIPEKANIFLEALKKHFDFKRILQIPKLEEISGMHLFYGIQLPIQSIISKELNILLPIIQSFEKPLEQRKINRVLIWEGENILSQIECNVIIDIFNKKGIKNIRLFFQSSSKKEFLKYYNDDSFDLIWICGHGEFNHMEAHKSFLNLGNGIHLNLDELNSNSLKITDRRLIVVNACDGATSSLINSPLSLGIGSALVCSKQSLISHQWPIDNYSALISGVLLASFLSDGLNYSEALNQTINLFYSGKENVLERIKQYCEDSDVIDRIEATSINFQNFYSWGSLALLI